MEHCQAELLLYEDTGMSEMELGIYRVCDGHFHRSGCVGGLI